MLCVTIRDDDSAPDIVQLGHATAGGNEPAGQTVQQQLPKRLTIQVGEPSYYPKRTAQDGRINWETMDVWQIYKDRKSVV